MTTNVMIVGVGGQGTLLASKTLGKLLLSQGYDVKAVSYTHLLHSAPLSYGSKNALVRQLD